MKKQAKLTEFEETSKYVYDNHFAYNLLYNLGEERKDRLMELIKKSGGSYCYTEYGSAPEIPFDNYYTDYHGFVILPNGERECYDSGLIRFLHGNTIKEIIKEIKLENKEMKANTLNDLTGKESKYVTAFTPPYSKLFITVNNFEENIEDLINQAYVESNFKEMFVYDEKFVHQGKQILVEVKKYPDIYGINIGYNAIEENIVTDCKQKAEQAMKNWQKFAEEQSALE